MAQAISSKKSFFITMFLEGKNTKNVPGKKGEQWSIDKKKSKKMKQ
jgi:hypothetical protein